MKEKECHKFKATNRKSRNSSSRARIVCFLLFLAWIFRLFYFFSVFLFLSVLCCCCCWMNILFVVSVLFDHNELYSFCAVGILCIHFICKWIICPVFTTIKPLIRHFINVRSILAHFLYNLYTSILIKSSVWMRILHWEGWRFFERESAHIAILMFFNAERPGHMAHKNDRHKQLSDQNQCDFKFCVKEKGNSKFTRCVFFSDISVTSNLQSILFSPSFLFFLLSISLVLPTDRYVPEIDWMLNTIRLHLWNALFFLLRRRFFAIGNKTLLRWDQTNQTLIVNVENNTMTNGI